MFSIDSRSRVPIYEQVGNNILHLVSTGALLPDDQLPSVRSLARELGVNPNTIQKAYAEMEAQGVIYQATGRGSFIASDQSLTSALTARGLKLLRGALGEAKRAGVTRWQAAELVEEAYKGESTC